MKRRERSDLVTLLLEKATRDLVVEQLRDNAIVADEIVAFHAQQAAEKTLKAVLMHMGVPYRRTHDLAELIDLGADRGVELPAWIEDSRVLTPFAVEYRYEEPPSDDEPFDRLTALRLVTRLVGWAREVVGAT